MFNVEVDSIGNHNGKNKYILLSGMKNIDDNNLQFQEFSKYLDKVLQQKGFVKTNFENADVAIFLVYDISEPKQITEQYSIPIWGQTGISSSQTYGTANNQTTYYTPTYGVTGYESGTRQYTIYTRYFKVYALDIEAYKNQNKRVQIWETTVISTGSSGDLRRVFPVLVVAAKDYIGTSTGKQVEIQLAEDDQKILDIKNSTK